jgi:site-specific DNA-methyltransferase (adenine-specific)
MKASVRPNRLIRCEASEIGDHLQENDRFDLVYLDPPYGVGTQMTARTRAGEARGRKHASSGPTAYDDAASIEPLVAMIVRAVTAIRDRMRETATLYLHLDYRAVHEVKVAIDAVLGRSAFLGEIVWVPGNGGRGAGLSVTHQTILVYARSGADRSSVVFHYDDPALREPYAGTSLAMHFSKTDADGRHYRERTIRGKAYRYYADAGRRIGSVWTDIPAMVANTPLRKESTGYPTQKPEKLLERILRASSQPGDTVADLMCGSGTTLAVAAKLGRRFIGGDRGALAIQTASDRLIRMGASFEPSVPTPPPEGQGDGTRSTTPEAEGRGRRE